MESFADHVKRGLGSHPKFLSSRFIYDEKGSRLFSQIMDMAEYYPSRAETTIISAQKDTILRAIGAPQKLRIIDIGAGDARKTQILLDHFWENGIEIEFVAIDISMDGLNALEVEFKKKYPTFPFTAICGEYQSAMAQLETSDKVTLGLFLGSNLGNFSPDLAFTFLKWVKGGLSSNAYFMLGVDLRKDPRRIISAYDDKGGRSAAFNLNLLSRINDEFGANFEPSAFAHFPSYDPQTGVMKSYLLSKFKQGVSIQKLEMEVHFKSWESIHIEYSRKFFPDEIHDLMLQNGFEFVQDFTDSDNLFLDSLHFLP